METRAKAPRLLCIICTTVDIIAKRVESLHSQKPNGSPWSARRIHGIFI